VSFPIPGKSAIIVVDMQDDFVLPGAPLAVPGAQDLIPRINKTVQKFIRAQQKIALTMDWHPADHCSFSQWPRHCVMHTKGASIVDGIDTGFYPRYIAFKGTNPDKEAYSGFQNTHLQTYLNGTQQVFVCGVATEYCVDATVHDCLALGYETYILSDCVAAVDPMQQWPHFKKFADKGAFVITHEALQ
jgi:nicotinamidase/pyrazinamidase